MFPTLFKTADFEQVRPDGSNSAFERVEKIGSVVFFYGRQRMNVFESNSSRRLLRELWKCGRKKITVRGVICSRGALSRSSVRALNVFLQCCSTLRGVNAPFAFSHRHAWLDLQREIDARWVR